MKAIMIVASLLAFGYGCIHLFKPLPKIYHTEVSPMTFMDVSSFVIVNGIDC